MWTWCKRATATTASAFWYLAAFHDHSVCIHGNDLRLVDEELAQAGKQRGKKPGWAHAVLGDDTTLRINNKTNNSSDVLAVSRFYAEAQ